MKSFFWRFNPTSSRMLPKPMSSPCITLRKRLSDTKTPSSMTIPTPTRSSCRLASHDSRRFCTHSKIFAKSTVKTPISYVWMHSFIHPTPKACSRHCSQSKTRRKKKQNVLPILKTQRPPRQSPTTPGPMSLYGLDYDYRQQLAGRMRTPLDLDLLPQPASSF